MQVFVAVDGHVVVVVALFKVMKEIVDQEPRKFMLMINFTEGCFSDQLSSRR